MACFLAAYASTPEGHPLRGKAHYRPARYGFDRVGFSPTGFHQEVSVNSHDLLLFQALLGANISDFQTNSVRVRWT